MDSEDTYLSTSVQKTYSIPLSQHSLFKIKVKALDHVCRTCLDEYVPGHKILSAFQHTVLGRSTGDDLGGSIVEMSVIVVVEHAGVEEFLLSNRDQDLHSKTVAERVQEGKLSSEVRSSIRGLWKIRSQRCFLI